MVSGVMHFPLQKQIDYSLVAKAHDIQHFGCNQHFQKSVILHPLGVIYCFVAVSKLLLLFMPLICVSVSHGRKSGGKNGTIWIGCDHQQNA